MGNSKNRLDDYRKNIDDIDEKIIELIIDRMKICEDIAYFKKSNNLPVKDETREEVKRKEIDFYTGKISENLKVDNEDMYKVFLQIFEMSKKFQKTVMRDNLQSYEKKILVINGPNINMLGKREPDVYGRKSFDDLNKFILEAADRRKVSISLFQSNHEGDIIDKIQEAPDQFDAIIINPAAYTHTSIAIMDALRAIDIPAVEVHLTNICERGNYRNISYAGSACVKTINGMGFDGYEEAIKFLCEE